MENMECLIVEAHTPVIDLKVGVLLGHGVSLLSVSNYVLWTHWVTFQAKKA